MRASVIIAAAFALGAVGCITVNINFPAKEVDRAAEVIVGEARPVPGPDGGTDSDGLAAPPEAPAPAEPEHESEEGPKGAFGPARLLAAAVLAGPAEEEPDLRIDIDTPRIKAIRESLTKRFPKLLPFYRKGAIGENREGFIEARDEAGLSLKEKRDLRALVEAENTDRRNLYRAIVEANDLGEENLKKVQARFAKNWIEKSRPGWWVQDEDGKWVKKPEPKKKKAGEK